ncbi:hypothetical protein QHH03_30285, partial [Aphanizomenon sp. 202]|nr:hypothetical protein [Aphanizomenon sp. 202]
GCRDSKNVVSEDLDWSVQLAISYKLSPFRAELLTISYSLKYRFFYYSVVKKYFSTIKISFYGSGTGGLIGWNLGG